MSSFFLIEYTSRTLIYQDVITPHKKTVALITSNETQASKAY